MCISSLLRATLDSTEGESRTPDLLIVSSAFHPLCVLSQQKVVSTLTEGCFEKGDKFFEVAAVLIVVDQLLQFIGMYDDVKTAHLSQPELLVVDARKTHLKKTTQHTWR